MKLTLTSMAATVLAVPVADIISKELLTKDTLANGLDIEEIQPTREAVPDLKDFLADLYGEKPLTDNQILSLLIGSTPSPDENTQQVTEAALTEYEILNEVATTSLPSVTESVLSDTDGSSDVVIETETDNDNHKIIENLEEIHEQELIHVLNEEIDLIENLKKTEIQLKDELRQLEIIKERRAEMNGKSDEIEKIFEEEVQESSLQSSAAQLTSISTLCMALATLMFL